MTVREIANDLYTTVRREIVMGLGVAFAPHRHGNLLDKFLKNYDAHAKDMFQASIDAAVAQERERCGALCFVDNGCKSPIHCGCAEHIAAAIRRGEGAGIEPFCRMHDRRIGVCLRDLLDGSAPPSV